MTGVQALPPYASPLFVLSLFGVDIRTGKREERGHSLGPMETSSGLRVLTNLNVHVVNPTKGLPKSGHYDLVAMKSGLVFLRSGSLGRSTTFIDAGAIPSHLSRNSKNFSISLSEVVSIQIKRGIPLTIESKVLIETIISNLVLEIDGSSVDPSRLSEAQMFFESLPVGRIEGIIEDVLKAKKMPSEIYRAILCAVLAAIFGFIRGSLWIYIVGGTAAVAGVGLMAPAIFLVVLCPGLYRGRGWAWALAIIVAGLGVALQIYFISLDRRLAFIDVLASEGGILVSLLSSNARRFFREEFG